MGVTKVNMHEAKTRLSQLVELAKSGEEVILAKNGRAEARIVPFEVASKESWIGMDAGKIWMAPDFDELPEDFLKAYYGEDPNETSDPR